MTIGSGDDYWARQKAADMTLGLGVEEDDDSRTLCADCDEDGIERIGIVTHCEKCGTRVCWV